MSGLIKGQATRLSGTIVQFVSGNNVVAIPLQANAINGKPFSLNENNEFCTSSELKLEALASVADKIKLIAKGMSAITVKSDNFETTLQTVESGPFWAFAEVYQNNGGWKLRFLNESISDIAGAAKWSGFDAANLQALLDTDKKLGGDIGKSAGKLTSSGNKTELVDNVKNTASALKNEGLSLFNRLRGKAKSEVKKLQGRAFLDAAMATAALVAYADGDASAQEERKLLEFVQTTDALNAYSLDEVKGSFTSVVAQLRTDKIIGQGKAFSVIEKFANKDESSILIALAISVANSENGIDDDEKAVIRKVIAVLKANEALYGEYL